MDVRRSLPKANFDLEMLSSIIRLLRKQETYRQSPVEFL